MGLYELRHGKQRYVTANGDKIFTILTVELMREQWNLTVSQLVNSTNI